MRLQKDVWYAAAWFGLSTLITWWFVQQSDIYASHDRQLLSTAIAGAKWTLQIVAGWVLLKHKAWRFIKNIGVTCFVGSLFLLPYCLFSAQMENAKTFFIGSLLVSIAVMVYDYRRSVLSVPVSIRWYYGWLLSLAIAIILQLTVVFDLL